MIVRFNGQTFVKRVGRWFIWESSMGTFRPIDGYDWDGTTFVIDDKAYCSDPMDIHYGFGTTLMKQACKGITELYESHVETAPEVPFLDVRPVEWFFDRPLSLTKCAPRDRAAWKKFVQNHGKTLRKHPRKTFTKRTLMKKK